MLPLPLILAIVMAGLVIVIIFLLFRSFGEQKEDVSRHTLQINKLKDELAQKETAHKEVTAARNKLQGEIRIAKEETEKLEQGLAAKDKLYQELKSKYSQLEKQAAEKKILATQLEQEKKRVRDHVVKYKKLEKNLHAKDDELAKAEKEKQKLVQEKADLEKELVQVKKDLEQAKQGEEGKIRGEEGEIGEKKGR